MSKNTSIKLSVLLVLINVLIVSIILVRINVFDRNVQAEMTDLSMDDIIAHNGKNEPVAVKELPSNTERFLRFTGNPYLFLTFDDGPNEHTLEILKILKSYNIKSTFFMLSPKAEENIDIVKKVKEDGHTIACHGVTHNFSKFYKNANSPKKEMEACSKTVESIIGEETNIVRVPYGSHPNMTDAQKEVLAAANFLMWDWNVDSYDWKAKSAKQITNNVLTQVDYMEKEKEVPVLLFHDKELTAKALPNIIENLLDRGYTFKAITPEDQPVQFD